MTIDDLMEVGSSSVSHQTGAYVFPASKNKGKIMRKFVDLQGKRIKTFKKKNYFNLEDEEDECCPRP